MMMKFDSQKQLVYEKILIYFCTLFAQFSAQTEEKERVFYLYGGIYVAHLSNPNKLNKS